MIQQSRTDETSGRMSSKAPKKTRAIPPGYTSLTPFITCRNARVEMDFLERAFGAEKRSLLTAGTQGERIAHAEVKLGTSMLMLADANPEMPCGKSVADLGGSPTGFYIYVDDVDAAFKRATEAGGKPKGEGVQDMFWGDRVGTIECPEGFQWTLASHVRDMTQEEIEDGQKIFINRMKEQAGLQEKTTEEAQQQKEQAAADES